MPARAKRRLVRDEAVLVAGGHGPIPELSWPSMTMEFGVGPGVSLQGLAPGDRVRFGVVKAPDDTYTAATIERLGGAGGTP